MNSRNEQVPERYCDYRCPVCRSLDVDVKAFYQGAERIGDAVATCRGCGHVDDALHFKMGM